MFPGVASNLVTYKRSAGTNPAAGIEVTETVPAGESWWLLGFYIQIVQGITQTPQPILQIDDGANVIFESVGSSAAQAVSTTCSYSWGVYLPLSGQIGATPNIRSTAPLSLLLLGPGYRIKTSTLGIGANTDYGVPSLYIARIGGTYP